MHEISIPPEVECAKGVFQIQPPVSAGCPQGLEKLEKGLILENWLEKLEKHILFVVLRLEKLGKSILWT